MPCFSLHWLAAHRSTALGADQLSGLEKFVQPGQFVELYRQKSAKQNLRRGFVVADPYFFCTKFSLAVFHNRCDVIQGQMFLLQLTVAIAQGAALLFCSTDLCFRLTKLPRFQSDYPMCLTSLFIRYAHGPVPLQSQQYTTSQDIINSVNYIRHEMASYKPSLTQVRAQTLCFCYFSIWLKMMSSDLNLHSHTHSDYNQMHACY